MFIRKLSLSMSNIVIAMVIGHIALVYVGIVYPERLEGMIEVAGVIKKGIVGAGLPSKYNVWVRLLLEEKQLCFMFFTVMARLLLSFIQGAIGLIWRRIWP